MSGRVNGGGTSAPGGARPSSHDSTSSAPADATLEEELLRNGQKEIEDKAGAQGTPSSAPPSPSKVLGVVKNSAPSSPSAARTLRQENTVAGTSESVPGVAATDETRSEQQPVAHTRSELAAVIQEAAAAEAQGEAVFAEMEQAMTGLLDPSHKKVEAPKLPCDFASKCPSSDADPLHGGVMDDSVILASGSLTKSSDYQVENDSILDKMVIMGSAGVNSKEELFHHIKSLKDSYLYKLLELDRRYTVPNLTEEQLQSSEKTEDFQNRVRIKKSIRKTLKFLQVERSHVYESYDSLIEELPNYKDNIKILVSVLEELEVPDVKMNAAAYSGGKRPQQQQAQPADASPSFPISSPEGQVQREGAETLAAKNPFNRLRYVLRSSSPEALCNSVRSMWSVFRESDSVPHGNVVAFPDLTSSQQLVFGSMDDCGMPFEGDASDSESSGLKRQKMQNANYAVLEEITAINRTLIDTEIIIAEGSGNDRITSSCDAGTTIKLSYTAVAISPDLRSLFASSEKWTVMPAKLSVPPDYPERSPMLIIDKGDDQLRKKSSTISDSVHAAFSLAFVNLPEPRLITDIAKAWDTCVQTAVTEFVQQYGGGTFSSRFGPWERCAGT